MSPLHMLALCHRLAGVVAVVAVVVGGSGCTLLSGSYACVAADEETCPPDAHCRAGACVSGAPRCGDGDVTGDEECDSDDATVCVDCRDVVDVIVVGCGDGVINGDEDCDINLNDGQNCNSGCVVGVCGDGVLGSAEDCDTDGDDNCNPGCTAGRCGDGVVGNVEGCDVARLDTNCNEGCVLGSCGDGVVGNVEDCDPARAGGPNCNSDCREGACGDGIVGSDEDCDTADLTSNCNAGCVGGTCGDGFRGNIEGCDDGADGDDSDGCTDDCVVVPVCGDGVVDDGEPCDVGLLDDNNCNPGCVIGSCGDGIAGTTEGCDESGADTATCTPLCNVPAFNDGRVDIGLGEVCDDDNADAEDACHNGAPQVRSCTDVLALDPSAPSGGYSVDVDLNGPLPEVLVQCIMNFDGGTWTRVFHSGAAAGTTPRHADLVVGNTTVDGSRLSTAHIAALARRASRVHIQASGNAARAATSTPGALPIRRLRAGASLAPPTPSYRGATADWTGPFAARLRTRCLLMSAHNTVPDFFDSCGDTQSLLVFDDGTQALSRWAEAEADEPIEIWVGGGPVCGDGFLAASETCDDGNGVDGDGCNNDCAASCGDGDIDVLGVAFGGHERAMTHAADLNDDGFDDLVVLELFNETPVVSVGLGGSRGFAPLVEMARMSAGDLLDEFVGGIGGSEVTDLNDDGFLDVVVYRQFDCGFVTLLGNGVGALSEAPDFRFLDQTGNICGQFEEGVARARQSTTIDLDDDEDLDVVLPRTSGSLVVATQIAPGTFAPGTAIDVNSFHNCDPRRVIAGDIVGGGEPDLIVLCNQTAFGVLVLPDRDTADRIEVNAAFIFDDGLLVDVDHNGFLDLVASGEAGTQVFLGNGDTLRPSGSSALGGRLAVGDVERDSEVEIVVGVVAGPPFQILRVIDLGVDVDLRPFGAVGNSSPQGAYGAPAVTRAGDAVAVAEGLALFFRSDAAESCDPDSQSCVGCQLR